MFKDSFIKALIYWIHEPGRYSFIGQKVRINEANQVSSNIVVFTQY